MRIYRIEDKHTGNGPYQGDKYFNDPRQNDMGYSHSNDSHPSMWRDCTYNYTTARYDKSSYYCGFSDIDRLLTWFSGWLKTLRRNGYTIAVYECDDEYVIDGRYQTVFVKDAAMRIETIALSRYIR